MKQDNTARMSKQIADLIDSRHTLLWIVTDEERRVERFVATVAISKHFAIRYWDCAGGVTDVVGNQIQLGEDDHQTGPLEVPSAAFSMIRERKARELWVLRDLHAHLDDAWVRRALKNLALELQDDADLQREAVVVVISTSGEVPNELRQSTTVVDWPLPDKEEIEVILNEAIEIVQASSGKKSEDIASDAALIIDTAAGLTGNDAANAFALSLVEEGAIRPEIISRQKRQIIARERTLTWWPPDPRGLEAIGGLDVLKDWVTERRGCFEPGAREFGLSAPKGLLLAGVPGCGKSASAKAIPAAWGGWPLLRLDLGALKGSLVGQSEENIRRALKLADAMGRVVLWLDEIGKAIAGATQHSGGDSGVAADALSELLFWMQEHKGEAFIIATTNEVDLPPELIRRFDELFFVDLPTSTERRAIIEVALQERGRDPSALDLSPVVAATANFSGDEVTKLVPAGLLTAWGDGQRQLTEEDLINAAACKVPMWKSSGEKIQAMRNWARGRAVSASLPEPAAPAAVEAAESVMVGRFKDLKARN